jgi:hypothetical protein
MLTLSVHAVEPTPTKEQQNAVISHLHAFSTEDNVPPLTHDEQKTWKNMYRVVKEKAILDILNDQSAHFHVAPVPDSTDWMHIVERIVQGSLHDESAHLKDLGLLEEQKVLLVEFAKFINAPEVMVWREPIRDHVKS